jgi:ankyrin repeat protein
MNRLFLTASTLLLLCAGSAAAASDAGLIEAVKRQDLRGVEALLKQGADVNQQQESDGATALQWAAYVDDVPILDALIRAGAKPNLANQLGVTPLMLACANRNPATVDLLLKGGADPNAKSGDRESPVMTAARVGNPAVLKMLLEHGGDANAKEALQGQTALMWAVSQQHPDVVRLLVDHGADVKARTEIPPPRRRMGQAGKYNPANGAGAAGAAGGGNAGVIIPLPRGNGFTALLFASRVGDLESAKILLEAGADVNDAAADGMSALTLATVRANIPVAKLLIEHGANPNADGAGYSALHWAVGTWESELTVRNITVDRPGEWATVAGLKEGKLELVNAMLAHGADPNARMKKAPARVGGSKNGALPELDGATPVMLAAMAGDAEVMRALVAAGADPKLKTPQNGTVLMAAAGLGHVQGEDFVKDGNARDAAKLAIELGVDPKAADAVGNTALHYAAYMRHDAVVQLLADQGAPLDAKNKYGETPLWDAELVVQFMGGGTFQMLPSSTSALLRKLGAPSIEASYTRARPTDWPDNPRVATDQVEAPVKTAKTGAPE